MAERRPPRGIPAARWRRLLRAAACAIADADLAPNDGTPEEYAEAALRAIAADEREHQAALAEARRLLEQAMHLRQHGERAPGGDETWEQWDRDAEAYLRGGQL